MRSRFPGYYRPSEDEFAQIWKSGLFIPDTNILLHLFRYGHKTRAQVIETLERFKPRIWIPYRVGLEFQRRWRDVDHTNREAYDKLTQEIDTLGRKLAALFNEYTRHQIIDAKREQEEIEQFVKTLCTRLADSKQNHPTRADAEQIFLAISNLIGDSVGTPPTSDQLAELRKEGESRFEREIPPGYRDYRKKEGDDRFGDFFIWNEILEKSRTDAVPAIVITDDVKDDWWLEFRGEKIGPRPELVEEVMRNSGQNFHLYTLSQFLSYSEKFLNQEIDKDALEEIKSDENQRREVARRKERHVIPRAVVHQMEQRIRREQEVIRNQLEFIESRLEELSVSSNPEQHYEVGRLLRERHNLLESSKDLSGRSYELRQAARRRIPAPIPDNIAPGPRNWERWLAAVESSYPSIDEDSGATSESTDSDEE